MKTTVASPDVTTVLLVGVGGQGTILASDVLAKVAAASGLDVKLAEVHGMSQRGGRSTRSCGSDVRSSRRSSTRVWPITSSPSS